MNEKHENNIQNNENNENNIVFERNIRNNYIKTINELTNEQINGYTTEHPDGHTLVQTNEQPDTSLITSFTRISYKEMTDLFTEKSNEILINKEIETPILTDRQTTVSMNDININNYIHIIINGINNKINIKPNKHCFELLLHSHIISQQNLLTLIEQSFEQTHTNDNNTENKNENNEKNENKNENNENIINSLNISQKINEKINKNSQKTQNTSEINEIEVKTQVEVEVGKSIEEIILCEKYYSMKLLQNRLQTAIDSHQLGAVIEVIQLGAIVTTQHIQQVSYCIVIITEYI